MFFSGSWFYSPTCKVNVWNLGSILNGTRKKPPMLPDFMFHVDDDYLDKCYAIISDSGIMLRNVHTFMFDFYFDFILKVPTTLKTE